MAAAAMRIGGAKIPEFDGGVSFGRCEKEMLTAGWKKRQGCDGGTATSGWCF